MLLVFATVALASASNQEAGRHLDNMRDAYEYGKSFMSDASEVNSPILEIDSIFSATPEVASVETPQTDK